MGEWGLKKYACSGSWSGLGCKYNDPEGKSSFSALSVQRRPVYMSIK